MSLDDNQVHIRVPRLITSMKELPEGTRQKFRNADSSPAITTVIV